MKIEQAKALFFAQYLGQKVFLHDDWKGFNDKSYKEVDPTYLQTGSNRLNGGYLLLRSVERLTDEEKIALYHLHSAAIGYDYTQDFADILTMANHWLDKDGLSMLFKYTCTSDYLRLIGVLTRFTFLDETGKPVTISPDEILSLNWAKIK